MKTYHILRNGEQSDPHPLDELKTRLAAGELSEEDLCWSEGMSEWQPLRRVLSPGPASAPPPPPSPANPPAASRQGTSSFVDAMKNLGYSLLALAKSLLVSIRAAAEKINRGAADIRRKAADLAQPSALTPAPPPSPATPGNEPSTPDHQAAGGDAPSSSESVPDASEQPVAGHGSVPAPTDTNRRRINWIPALVLFCFSALFLCGIDICSIDGDSRGVQQFSLFGLPVIILGLIFLSVLHYRCWKTVPLEFRATTPGKAVGFMFIPFFNFYWAFISWPKLSEGLSKWQRSAGVIPSNTRGLGVTFAVLFVCHMTLGLIPVLGILIRIAMVVIFIIYYLKLTRGLNGMLGGSAATTAAEPAAFWTAKRTYIGMAVVCPIYFLLFATYDPPTNSNYSSSERLPSWYTAVQGMSGDEYSRNQRCGSCNGSGVSRFASSTCKRCSGGGTVTTGSGYAIACPSCDGQGRISTCQSCAGTGYTR